MSNETDRLEEQLRRSFEGGAWHGPALLEVVADVSPEDAHAHPIAGAHSIWELVLHLEGTYRLVLGRLKGVAAPLAPEQDWPTVPSPTAENWQAALRTLRQLSQELRGKVRAFPASRLDEPLLADPPHTAHTQFIGVTQHDLYHAGQVAILKRALAASKRQRASPKPQR
jgi:uncharacterized damage-inducible protein DinB